MFFWNIRGREKVTLNNENLTIERLGTFLTLPKKYETNLIDGFEAGTRGNRVTIWTIYGFSGGRVSFDYWEKPKHFGQTITEGQAKEIADKLNLWIKNYAQHGAHASLG
jgi:hypothetical protein